MAASRITAVEFILYLKELWRKIQVGAPHATTPPIGEPIDIASLTISDVSQGLCVSGGPDSMALACLMRQVQREGNTPPFDLIAFIINHRAREGSAEEAERVSARLHTLGRELRLQYEYKAERISRYQVSNSGNELASRCSSILAKGLRIGGSNQAIQTACPRFNSSRCT
jgi:PP-loop family